MLRAIFLTAISIEAIGASCLYLRTGPKAGWEAAAYPAVFHSIRAFCNAGFALYADSFIGCREDWIVNGVLAALIIVGGIGFVVIADVKGCLFNKSRTPRSLSLHSSLALTASAILVLAGTVAILCMEWKNTLAPLSIPGRLPAALFQSITARTAGINTLNMVQATSVVMISAAVITLAIMVLMTSVLGGLSHTQTRGRFLELFFETISAFGTVGLSAGVTGSLSTVGPITIFVFRLVRGFGKLGADRTNMGLPVRESPRSYGPRHAGNVHGPGTAKGAGQAVRPCRLRGPENTEGILVPG